MHRLIKPCAVALSLASLGGFVAAPAHAQILQNGSFEQGTFNSSGNQSLPVGSTAISNWTVTNAEIALLTNGNYGIVSPYGNYFLDLTGYHDSVPYGGVTQNIATTSGDSYHLSFSLGTDQTVAFSGPASAVADAGGTSQSFTFAPVPEGGGSQWGTFGLDFIAAGGTTVITITGTQSAGGQFIGLDNVSVTQNPAAVPEASTILSFGLLLGLGGMVAAAKRRSAAQA